MNSPRAGKKVDSGDGTDVFKEVLEGVKVRLSWVVFEGEIAVKREVRFPDLKFRESVLV